MADDNGNPFDRPLDSELQEHQQQQAATVKSSPIGNPFDEPLLSEKAEAQAASSLYLKKVNTGPLSPADQAEKAMGEAIGDNKAQAVEGLKNTGMAALETAGGVLGASEFAPVAERVAGYLPHLARIIKVGRDLGLTGIGLKEAHDLYKALSEDKK
jgi:hypothetical protein